MKKNSIVAMVLSFLIVGAGQIYLGQVAKGLAMMAGAVVAGVVVGLVAGQPVGFLGTTFSIMAGLDALRISQRINAGETVGKWEFRFN